jgi:pimeloyl-ACP methyl ester carboxylesterase
MVTPEQWRSRGSFFPWAGHRVFSRVEGAGEPLLLIHGFPTASWDYYAIWPALVARYRVLAIDMLGFGFSAKPRDFPYSIMAQADLFEAFLAREGVSRFRMLAHDYGLTVAQELLARRVNLQSVVLLNGGAFPETHRALPTQKLLASPVGPLLAKLSSYGSFAKAMRGIWGATPPQSAELRAMWHLVTEHTGMDVMPKLIGYMAERRKHRERWVSALQKPVAPVRLINGLADPISGAHMVARYRELVPAPNVVELPDVGHYPQVEAPAAVVKAALDHFAA